MAFMAFWFWMVSIILRVSGCEEQIIKLFLIGFPYGIHKMCILLVPKGMDTGGTVGVAALSVIVGGVMGCIMIPYYILRAVYVLICYIFSLIKR
jgi:hypothetical protein